MKGQEEEDLVAGGVGRGLCFRFFSSSFCLLCSVSSMFLTHSLFFCLPQMGGGVFCYKKKCVIFCGVRSSFFPFIRNFLHKKKQGAAVGYMA